MLDEEGWKSYIGLVSRVYLEIRKGILHVRVGRELHLV